MVIPRTNPLGARGYSKSSYVEGNSPRTDGIQAGADTPRVQGIGGKKGVCVREGSRTLEEEVWGGGGGWSKADPPPRAGVQKGL